MQEALNKWQPTPSASAGAGDSGYVASGYSTTPRLPSYWPLSWLLTAARVRTQVQRFHFQTVCVLLIFMETLKVNVRTPPTHPSIHWYHHSFNRDVFSIHLVPGTMLSHEDEETAASKRPLSTPFQKKEPLSAWSWPAGGETLPHPSPITRPRCGVRGVGGTSPRITEATLLGSPVGVHGTSH